MPRRHRAKIDVRLQFREVERVLTGMQGLRGTVEATFDVTSVLTIPAPQQAGQVLDRDLLENALDNISNGKCASHNPAVNCN